MMLTAFEPSAASRTGAHGRRLLAGLALALALTLGSYALQLDARGQNANLGAGVPLHQRGARLRSGNAYPDPIRTGVTHFDLAA